MNHVYSLQPGFRTAAECLLSCQMQQFRFLFKHVLTYLLWQDSKWSCSITVWKRKVLALGVLRGLTLPQTFFSSFLNRWGRKDLAGDLISRKAIQHTAATSSAVQGIVALSQARSSLQKCFIKSGIVASAIVRCYRGECDLWKRETFIIRGPFDSAFPYRLLFLFVPAFGRTYFCLFLKIPHTSITAAHRVFLSEQRPQVRMPLRNTEILHSHSSHLHHPIPHPSCCLSLLKALAAKSPDPCTILLLNFPLGIDLRITSFFCLFIHSEHVPMY